ncbi:PAS domain S-box protein [Paenibacillus lautus]|uniref:sensor histidine kinase n=1 Tax=Paenibacillus lautus TaxID=1401 RepID=UPI002DBAB8D4|nr:PAS domain S-box protein [Paenibacillus lautus]MEC0203668.1 PAS domain S-box protein [Paenibacillus lautus]
MCTYILGATILVLVALTIIFWIFLYRSGYQRKLSHQALDMAEGRFRLLDDMLLTLDVGIWSYDFGTRRIQNTSLAFHKITGYSHRDFADGLSWETLIHPEDMTLFRSLIDKLRQGEAVHTEYRIIHAEGDVRWVQVKMIPTLNESGQIVRTDGIAIDITTRFRMEEALYDMAECRKMEQALKESMNRYRRLVELSPIAIAVCKDRKLMYVNPAGLRILGAAGPESILGTDPWDWVLDPYEERTRKRLTRLIRSGEVVPEELSIKRVDGEQVDVVATALYDAESDAIEIFFENITARKSAERALMESDRINRHILDIAPVAMFLHSDFSYIYANPAGFSLLGLTDIEQLAGTSLQDIIPSDQVEFVISEVEHVYESGSTSELAGNKLVRLDGTIIDIEAITTPIPYIGRNTALTIIRDVTEQKRAERERIAAERLVRESEDLYFRLQMSLDQFSSDLFGMVKISELNARIVREIKKVLGTDRVSLIQINHHSLHIKIQGGHKDPPQGVLHAIHACGPEHIPFCKLFEMSDGYFVKIGEMNGDSSIVCIGGEVPQLMIQAQKIWLETITRYASVLYDNFRVIEDLTRELEKLGSSQQIMPLWLLRLMLHLSENERKRLSQDLHDAALQEQIIWYRKLNQITSDHEMPEHLRPQLEEIEQGLLDVIYQIRITCNELRPPLLKEEGLERSLEALFEFTQLRTNYSIQFDCSNFDDDISDDHLIGLYRIVQELLANATKHSNATEVKLRLSTQSDEVNLSYEDNGIGIDPSQQSDQFNSMGIGGMKERVRSMNGKIQFDSSDSGGLAVYISITAR